MTQEDKELLLKDLCGRLPYDCKVAVAEGGIDGLQWDNMTLNSYLLYKIEEEDGLEYVKPYLRPMYSMTEEEKKEYQYITERWMYDADYSIADSIDWLNKNMFDYRGLIALGLAIEVSPNNNSYKE